MASTILARSPATDAELIRSFHDRIRNLELSNTVRVGEWVVASRDGNLVASKPGQQLILNALPVETVTSAVKALPGVAAIPNIDTGIDLSSIGALLAQLLALPLSFLGSTPLGGVLDILGQFLPFLSGADADTFDPLTAAGPFISTILSPTGLLPLLTGGLLSGSVIPGLDASKIISGIFGTGLIPGLDVSKIISGVFGGGFIPSLDASKIGSGIFGTGLIPGLDVSKIISGVFGGGFIPSLDASKIGSGTFGDGFLPGLGLFRDAVAQSMLGGTTSGYTAGQVKTALQAIPGGNIATTILAAIVPTLDASKITSGTFASSFVPDVVNGFKNIYNNWFGGTTATGTPAEVATAIAAIKTTVAGGFTLQTVTTSNAAFTTPAGLLAATEAYVGVVGGGGKGTAGLTVKNDVAGATAAGGSGGIGGGYKRVKIANPAGLSSTLNITIGAAASTNGASGGVTSVGSLVSSTAGIGSTEVSAEYLSSSSAPGDGGAGGSATTGTRNTGGTGSAATGSTGGSSATAAGGAGGAGVVGTSPKTGTAGTVGAAGQTGTTPISGGAGGGGGGGATCNQISGTANATGGAGGAGGYPGGGSGGGGGAASINDLSATVTGGAAGTPANGFAFLLWR